jgi:integrase
VRKADARRGRKLPVLRNTKAVTMSELIDDDLRNYRSRGEIVRESLGSRVASEITPKELLAWLNKRKKSAGTFNRYKAFIGLCFRVGEDNGKVDLNPARKFRPRKESAGRIRYLHQDEQEKEYDRLLAAVTKLFPEHVAEFVVSVHTGMRLSEQYTVDWSEFQPRRKRSTSPGQKTVRPEPFT